MLPSEDEVRVMALFLLWSSLPEGLKSAAQTCLTAPSRHFSGQIQLRLVPRCWREDALAGEGRAECAELYTQPPPYRQQSRVVTSCWQAHKYSAGTEGYLSSDVIFHIFASFWNSAYVLGRWVPLNLLQGTFWAHSGCLPCLQVSTCR